MHFPAEHLLDKLPISAAQQLRAFAENLYTLANRHRENGNYVVAHALYGRALTLAQGIDTRERNGKTESRAARHPTFRRGDRIRKLPRKIAGKRLADK